MKKAPVSSAKDFVEARRKSQAAKAKKEAAGAAAAANEEAAPLQMAHEEQHKKPAKFVVAFENEVASGTSHSGATSIPEPGAAVARMRCAPE